jgi:FKBP-type peptidyl-prolyl cis-trans isomerase
MEPAACSALSKELNQWENVRMRKTSVLAAFILVAATGFAGVCSAQQSATTSPKKAPATQSTKKPANGARQAPAKKSPAPLALSTQKQKQSYAIGLNIGKSMKRDAVEVDTEILARGIRDALAGGKTLLTDEEVKATLTELQVEVRKHQQDEFQAEADKNKKDGDAFLAANKTKEGVVTLPSGLQYKILKEGTGPKPAAQDTVVCNYRGTLLDNTEFDSSEKHGGPASFPVNQVIKGWTEALQLMPVGSKWQLFVPSELAYGPRQAGPQIGPNSTLIFEVELLSIKEKEPPKEAPKDAPKDTPKDKEPL